jgi:hypothetical protein
MSVIEHRSFECRQTRLFSSRVLAAIMAGGMLIHSGYSVLGVTPQGQEPSYAVEGRLTYKVLIFDPARPRTIETAFRISVRGASWLIELTPDNIRERATSSTRVGCDGTNVYRVAVLNHSFDNAAAQLELLRSYQEYAAKMQLEGFSTGIASRASQQEGEIDTHGIDRPISKATNLVTKRPWNDATATIWPGTVPQVGRGDYDVLWLAFASHGYFSTPDLERAPTVGMLPPRSAAGASDYAEKAEWLLLSDSPGLPQSLRFYNDGYRYSDDPEVRTKLAAPFDEGYLKAEYTVTATANFGALVLPRRFVYSRFGPRPGATANTELDTIASWEAIVSRVMAPDSDAKLIPQVEQNTRVADHRVMVKSGERAVAATYRMDDGDQWKTTQQVASTPDVLLQIEIEQRKQRRPGAYKIKTHAWPVLLVFVALNVLSAAVFLSLRRRRQMDTR